MSRSALIVATVSSFLKTFEMNDISILKDMGYNVHIATNLYETDYSVDSSFFQKNGVVPHHIGFVRFPFKISNFKAIRQIRKIIDEYNIELVHCHTPVGSVIARLAAKKYRKNGCKVIYTAHGLQFYPKKDWMIYYPVEKWLSRYTDAIIAINLEDYDLVSKRFHNAKTNYIPGVGVDLSGFCNTVVDRKQKRKGLGVGEQDFWLLSVGEINDNKNHKIVINAIGRMNDPRIKYYIAGEGPLTETITKLIDDLGLDNQIKLLGQRTDVKELLKCADAFVHPSKREGLSLALMESMAGGLPVICSKIRGNVDLIDNNQGGFLCKVNSVDDYADAITKLMNDKELCKRFADHNQKKIHGFSIDVVDKIMRDIYNTVLHG